MIDQSIVVTPQMHPLRSSNLSACGFKDNQLFIRFHTGDVWRYEPVTPKEFTDLRMASSPGGYFHRFIKSNPNKIATRLTAERVKQP